MADNQIRVELELDDGNFRVRVRGAGDEIQNLARRISTIDRSVQRSERHIRGFTATLRDWTIIIGQARNAINQLSFVTYDWAARIVRTNAEIERMTLLLRGMSDEQTAAAKAIDADKTLDQLFKMAKEAPFSINAITDAMVKMKSVGMDPMDGSLQSLLDATAAFGGTEETMHRASIAIQQMAGKGVISMEELRQQLGEAVPTAIATMARELGVTYGELVEEVSNGTVEASRSLQAMLLGFSKEFQGRALAMMRSFNGQVARLRTNLTEAFTQNEGMETYFDAVKDSLNDFNRVIESGGLDGYLDTLGTWLANTVGLLRNVVGFAAEAMGNLTALYSMLSKRLEGTWLEDAFGWMVAWADKSVVERFEQASALGDRFFTAMDGMLSEAGDGLREKAREYFQLPEDSTLFDGENFVVNQFRSLDGSLEAASPQAEAFKKKLAEMLDPEDGLNALMREKMLMGLRVDPSQLGEATALIIEQNRHVEELAGQFERLKSCQKGALQVEQATQQGVPVMEMEGVDPEAIKAWIDAGRQSAEELQSQMYLVRDAVREASDETEQLKSSLGNMEMEAAKITADDFIDANDISDELNALDDQRRESLDALIADTTASQEEATAERLRIEEEYYTAAIGAYEGMLAIAAASIDQSSQAGMEAFAIAEAWIRERLNKLATDMNTTLSFIKTTPGIPTIPGSGSKKKKGGGGKSDAEKMGEDLKKVLLENQRAVEQIADPFAYEIPNAIDRVVEKYGDMSAFMKSGLAALTGQVRELFLATATLELNKEVVDWQERAREARRAIMGEQDARQDAFNEEVTRLQNLKKQYLEWGLWRIEHEQQLQDAIAALKAEMNAESPLGQFANEWKNYFEDMESFAVDTVKGISDSIAEMVVDGKADFEDLARSALKSFISLQLNGLFSIGASFLQKWIGGMGGGTAAVAHDGAIIGGAGGRSRQVDMGLFAGARRMHTGGIVGSDEVPTILQKREGVFTPEQMKALGLMANRGQGAAPVINVINQTGVQAETEQRPPRFDGEQMILDVVMKSAMRPGPFRDALKG